MKSILKMNFLLNIETYTFPVIKYQKQLFVYNTLVENCDHMSSFLIYQSCFHVFQLILNKVFYFNNNKGRKR